jgi:hypothetical protein
MICYERGIPLTPDQWPLSIRMIALRSYDRCCLRNTSLSTELA